LAVWLRVSYACIIYCPCAPLHRKRLCNSEWTTTPLSQTEGHPTTICLSERSSEGLSGRKSDYTAERKLTTYNNINTHAARHISSSMANETLLRGNCLAPFYDASAFPLDGGCMLAIISVGPRHC